MHTLIVGCLALSIALVLYVYAGYPLLIAAVASRKPPLRAAQAHDDTLPNLVVLIPACDEEKWIARKIENTLALDYPTAKLRIVIVSDGSTDRTNEITQTYAAHGVVLILLPQRLGKQEAFNRVIPQLREEVLLLTDANALLDAHAARRMARHFLDPHVGCVAGRRVCMMQQGSAASLGEGLYWRYESWIKANETRFYSCTCADGQIYAVRRAAVSRVEKGGEDFFIPMTMVANGLRVVFDPEAIAVVPAASDLRSEFRRKVRSHVSFLWNAWLLRRLLVPQRSPLWWQLTSHHVLRMAVPPAMLAIFACGAFLLAAAPNPFVAALLVGELLFYVVSLIGYFLAKSGLRPKLFYVPFYFTFAQVALGAAWLRWTFGQRDFSWQRTERLLDAS